MNKYKTFTFDFKENLFTDLQTKIKYPLPNGCSCEHLSYTDQLVIEFDHIRKSQSEVTDSNFLLNMEKIHFLHLQKDFKNKEMSIDFLLPAIECENNIHLLKSINGELKKYCLEEPVNVLLLLEFISNFIFKLSDASIYHNNQLRTQSATVRNKENSRNRTKKEETAFTKLFFLEKEYKGGPNSPHGKIYKELQNLNSIPTGKDKAFKSFKHKYNKWKKRQTHPGLDLLDQIHHKYVPYEVEYDSCSDIFSFMKNILRAPDSAVKKALHKKI